MTAERTHFLSPRIFPCDVDGHMIVLDLGADRYARLGDVEAAVLRHLFGGQGKHSTPAPPSLEASLDRLVEEGILTTDAVTGREAFPELPGQVMLDLKGYPHDGIPKIRMGHIVNCACAFVCAKFMRHFHSIERTVLRVKSRRERALANAGRPKSKKEGRLPEVDLARIRELVEIFRILKGLFYTGKGRCLFDSLTLIEFLAIYRIYPLWVFGVQMGPFVAHCWVQDDRFIYNDSADSTGSFKPIMSV
ncbi:lasso peptide biosynthesis B2 protein [Kordiimonas sp.]|uniref:lasso peptide biosynthesis B2 protein n=2 Tax=Kordiimonas sp. TaxID=1970157 RepID=UPI003B525106